MKKADSSHGVVLCFLINLALNFEWAAGAAVLYLLHRWLGLPRFFSQILIFIWIIQALVFALLVHWGNSCGTEEDQPRRENKNPYSARTKDLFPDRSEEKPGGGGQDYPPRVVRGQEEDGTIEPDSPAADGSERRNDP